MSDDEEVIPDIPGHPEWGDEKYCGDGKEHEPDPDYLVKADGAAWTIDTMCVHCGRSGSVAIDPKNFTF